MKATLNFYDEIISVVLPSTFEELKLTVCERFMMDWADVCELVYSYPSNGKTYPIASEKDSILFYTEIQQRTADDHSREVFGEIVRQERGHLFRLQRRLTQLVRE